MILTIRQASKRAGIPVRSIYRYIKQEILPAHKLGGNGHSRRHWRIRERDLEEFLTGQAGAEEGVVPVLGAEMEGREKTLEG